MPSTPSCTALVAALAAAAASHAVASIVQEALSDKPPRTILDSSAAAAREYLTNAHPELPCMPHRLLFHTPAHGVAAAALRARDPAAAATAAAEAASATAHLDGSAASPFGAAAGSARSPVAVFDDGDALVYGGVDATTGQVDMISPVTFRVVCAETNASCATDYVAAEAGYTHPGALELRAYSMDGEMVARAHGSAKTHVAGPTGRAMLIVRRPFADIARVVISPTKGAADTFGVASLAVCTPKPLGADISAARAMADAATAGAADVDWADVSGDESTAAATLTSPSMALPEAKIDADGASIRRTKSELAQHVTYILSGDAGSTYNLLADDELAVLATFGIAYTGTDAGDLGAVGLSPNHGASVKRDSHRMTWMTEVAVIIRDANGRRHSVSASASRAPPAASGGGDSAALSGRVEVDGEALVRPGFRLLDWGEVSVSITEPVADSVGRVTSVVVDAAPTAVLRMDILEPPASWGLLDLDAHARREYSRVDMFLTMAALTTAVDGLVNAAHANPRAAGRVTDTATDESARKYRLSNSAGGAAAAASAAASRGSGGPVAVPISADEIFAEQRVASEASGDERVLPVFQELLTAAAVTDAAAGSRRAGSGLSPGGDAPYMSHHVYPGAGEMKADGYSHQYGYGGYLSYHYPETDPWYYNYGASYGDAQLGESGVDHDVQTGERSSVGDDLVTAATAAVLEEGLAGWPSSSTFVATVGSHLRYLMGYMRGYARTAPDRDS